MGEEKKSFYKNLILESIRKTVIKKSQFTEQKTHQKHQKPLTGSSPYLPSVNIVNTSKHGKPGK